MDRADDFGPIVIRAATRADVPAIVRLLAADDLGRGREDPAPSSLSSYYGAFDALAADTCNELVVIAAGDEVIGTLQLTLIPSLTYRGGTRAASTNASASSPRTKA